MEPSESQAERDAKAATQARLHYVTDKRPGIRRVRTGSGFRLIGLNGRPLTAIASLRRIRALAIPPAWVNVWICPRPDGHIQATGRDAKGRKQYRYHLRWRTVRDENKFTRMAAFGRALPGIRRRVARDLRARGLGRNKVLATVVRLLDLCAVRVGNDEYAVQNRSYGITTLQDRHAHVHGSTIRLRFRGKVGKQHAISLQNAALARIVKKCQDLPGQELFQWVDEDDVIHDVTSGDINDYLAASTGQNFTSKDFRTWAGTVLAAVALCGYERAGSQRRTRANIARAIERVAERLGNTPAVCRKSYVHPTVLTSFLDGSLRRVLRPAPGQRFHRGAARLRLQECAVLTLLK